MQVSALEHCKKLAGEKSYLIELLQDGLELSIKEERNVNTEHVLVDTLLQQRSPCSGYRGFIGRRQKLDMCGNFQETWYCSIGCPYHFKKKAEHAKSLCHWVLHTLTEIGKWWRMETARMHLDDMNMKVKPFFITLSQWLRHGYVRIHLS